MQKHRQIECREKSRLPVSMSIYSTYCIVMLKFQLCTNSITKCRLKKNRCNSNPIACVTLILGNVFRKINPFYVLYSRVLDKSHNVPDVFQVRDFTDNSYRHHKIILANNLPIAFLIKL